eukprot:6287507-Alexandrium_andersonii.AAC.1
MAPQTCVLDARRPALVTLGHPNDVCFVRIIRTVREVVSAPQISQGVGSPGLPATDLVGSELA